MNVHAVDIISFLVVWLACINAIFAYVEEIHTRHSLDALLKDMAEQGATSFNVEVDSDVWGDDVYYIRQDRMTK